MYDVGGGEYSLKSYQQMFHSKELCVAHNWGKNNKSWGKEKEKDSTSCFVCLILIMNTS